MMRFPGYVKDTDSFNQVSVPYGRNRYYFPLKRYLEECNYMYLKFSLKGMHSLK